MRIFIVGTIILVLFGCSSIREGSYSKEELISLTSIPIPAETVRSLHERRMNGLEDYDEVIARNREAIALNQKKSAISGGASFALGGIVAALHNSADVALAGGALTAVVGGYRLFLDSARFDDKRIALIDGCQTALANGESNLDVDHFKLYWEAYFSNYQGDVLEKDMAIYNEEWKEFRNRYRECEGLAKLPI